MHSRKMNEEAPIAVYVILYNLKKFQMNVVITDILPTYSTFCPLNSFARTLSIRSPGTIIGVENVDCIRWPGSEWRCLKVTSFSITFKTFKPSN